MRKVMEGEQSGGMEGRKRMSRGGRGENNIAGHHIMEGEWG